MTLRKILPILLLVGLDSLAAEIPGLTLTRVPIATPRTVNPQAVAIMAGVWEDFSTC